MSNITGSAPVVYAQTIANGAPGGSAEFSDTDAVNHLLNFTQSRSWANYTTINMAVNASNLMLAQSANKSLIVAYNTQISTITTNVTNYSINTANAQTLDTLGFNKTASTILTSESFQMMSASPDDGVISNNDASYQLTLKELPTNSNEFNGLDNIRILNSTVASNFSVNYSATNVTSALGVEGKVYYFNSTVAEAGGNFAPQYQAIAGYQPLSTNSVTLNVSNLNTLNSSYNYELVKLSYDNPTFNMVGVNAGSSQVMSAFGTANLTALIPTGTTNAYSYTGFLQSLNYTGLLGNNISGVLSSSLVIGLSNASNVTQAFSFASGSANLSVNPTFVSISNLTTLAQANSLVFADSMSVQVTPSNVSAALANPAEPILNATQSIVIVPQAELLPSGKATDNITISTDSTQANRKVVTNNAVYNTTVQIQYATDAVSMLYPTVLGNNDNPDWRYQMTDQNLTYNVTMLAPSTIVTAPPAPAGFNVTANKDGVYSIYNLTSAYGSTFSVSNVVMPAAHTNVIGRLDSSSRMNFASVSTAILLSTQLPYLNNTNYSGAALNTTVAMNSINSSYLASYNILLDSQPSNNQTGFGVLGGSIDSIYGSAYAGDGKRLLLAPTDPLNNQNTAVSASSNCTTANASGALVAPSLNYGFPLVNPMNASHTLEYGVEWNGLGPVSYEDFTSGTYTQEYTLVFPSSNDVANGNLRVQGARIDAYNSSNARINASSYNVTLNRANISGLCLNACATSIPGVSEIMVTCNVLVDVSLSGLKPFNANSYVSAPADNMGSMYVNIPLSYNVVNTNGVYSWPGGIVPEMKVRINFDSNHLYTHKMTLQGKANAMTGWRDLDADTTGITTVASWYVDLRESYDILTYTAGNYYNLNVCLYPRQTDAAPHIYNSPFWIPLDTNATGWTGVYCSMDNQINRDLAQGLSLDQIQSLLNNPLSVKLNVSTSISEVGSGEMIAVTSGPVQFQVNIGQVGQNASVYFMYFADALISTVTNSDTLVAPYYANYMFYNNSFLPIDSGVYISSGTVTNAGRAVGDSIATISVLPDNYSATAFSGQTGELYNTVARIGANYPPTFPGGSIVLIPSALPASGVTTEMDSTISRGYPTATYVFNRSNMGLTATFGAYNESVSVLPPTIGNPTAITLNMSQGFNILLLLSGAATGTATTVFTANKTMVNASYGGDMYSYHTSPSLPTSVKVLNMVDGVTNQVPWIETLYLNNFFVAGASNTLNVNYLQAPLIVSRNTSSYQCPNISTSAATFVAGLSYTQTQSVSDAALVSNAYNIAQDQVKFTYSPSYVLRNAAKSFYVTVAPVDVTLSHYSGSSVGTARTTLNRYIQLATNVIPGYTLPVDTLTAPYAINVNFNLNQLKSDGTFPSSKFVYKNKLYSLRGSADGATNWNTYFSEVDFTNPVFPDSSYVLSTYSGSPYAGFYNLAFLQNGYSAGSGDEVNLVFSTEFIRSVYGSLPPSGGLPYSGWSSVYEWSSSIALVPATSSFLRQYELTFALNPTTKLVNPVITKYVSTSYPSDYLGAPGQLDTKNGYYNNQLCASANLMTSPSSVTVAGYPYQFQSAAQYPALSSGTFASVTFGTSLTPPSNMDFIYQVANGTTGSNFYKNLLSVVPGNFLDCKILNIFAKDQFVVQDYRGNLAMRVGPDGRFYAGDVSTYSVALIDNQSPVCNGLYVPVFNSDVNLRSS
jgi:hypothetical protein